MNDFDKWLHEQRIKQEDRKWASNYIFKCILGAILGIIIAKFFL